MASGEKEYDTFTPDSVALHPGYWLFEWGVARELCLNQKIQMGIVTVKVKGAKKHEKSVCWARVVSSSRRAKKCLKIY